MVFLALGGGDGFGGFVSHKVFEDWGDGVVE
jgi:hypothetical protein